MPAVMPPLRLLKEKAPAKPPLRLLLAVPDCFTWAAVMVAPAASATMREAALRWAVRVAELSEREPVPAVMACGEPTRAATGRLMLLPVPAPTKAPSKLRPRADVPLPMAPLMA